MDSKPMLFYYLICLLFFDSLTTKNTKRLMSVKSKRVEISQTDRPVVDVVKSILKLFLITLAT
jgi:hypothetical protein